MTKCLNTHQFSGFDKITKPEKMVARLAALFIKKYIDLIIYPHIQKTIYFYFQEKLMISQLYI